MTERWRIWNLSLLCFFWGVIAMFRLPDRYEGALHGVAGGLLLLWWFASFFYWLGKRK